MGVCKKERRKLTYNGKQYVWYVALDSDSAYNCLNIISGDKRLVLSCPLSIKISYVISKGTEFQNKKTNGCWQRYICPIEIPKIITPKKVTEIINWAENDNKSVKVEWDGMNIVL